VAYRLTLTLFDAMTARRNPGPVRVIGSRIKEVRGRSRTRIQIAAMAAFLINLCPRRASGFSGRARSDTEKSCYLWTAFVLRSAGTLAMLAGLIALVVGQRRALILIRSHNS
jgi:hypothetical protein